MDEPHEHITLNAINQIGSQRALAIYLGVQQPCISTWLRAKVKIPEKHMEKLSILLKKDLLNAA